MEATERLGFRSACQLVATAVRIVLDRIGAPPHMMDLPDEDGAYIDAMFDSLAHHEPQPDPDYIPRRRNIRRPKEDGER